MRKIVFLLSLVLALSFAAPVMAGNIGISAEEFGPYLAREEFTLLMNGKLQRKDSQVLWLNDYQVVYVVVKNDSDKPVNVNPGYFTLASSANKSYPFSADMYAVKHKMPWVQDLPIEATKVLPGTSVEGYLFFKKTYEKERPASIYFESPETSGSIKVQLDPKVKQ